MNGTLLLPLVAAGIFLAADWLLCRYGWLR